MTAWAALGGAGGARALSTCPIRRPGVESLPAHRARSPLPLAHADGALRPARESRRPPPSHTPRDRRQRKAPGLPGTVVLEKVLLFILKRSPDKILEIGYFLTHAAWDP